MTAPTGQCVGLHAKDPERLRPAWRGYLCRGCDRGLEQSVAELPALLDDLEQTLARSGTAGPKVSGSREQPLPYDQSASDAARNLHAVVAAWVLHVSDERGATVPQPPTTATLSRVLLTNHEWLVNRPEVDEYREQILAAVRQARGAVAPSIARRIDLGICDDVVACDVESHVEQQCPGQLRATVRNDGLIPDVICTECGTTHDPTAFRALARRLRKGEESWLTTAQASSLLHVPSGTVRRWAVEDEWRRKERDDRYATRWHADDVQATYDGRRLAPSRHDVRETRRGA